MTHTHGYYKDRKMKQKYINKTCNKHMDGTEWKEKDNKDTQTKVSPHTHTHSHSLSVPRDDTAVLTK